MANGNGEHKKANGEHPKATEIPEAEILEAAAPERAKLALQSIKREELMGLDLLTFASAAVNSGFFPTVESASQAVVKVLIGRDMGVTATAALRHIYVHKGHIGIQGELMAAKIKDSGAYDYRIIRSDDTVCELDFVQLIRGEWVTMGPHITFTMEEARKAKLIKNDSGWENYPSDMLFWRAMSRGQRRYVPHVFKGQTVYTPEEAKAAAGVIDMTPHALATVVHPDGLTPEKIQGATVTVKNDAPPGSSAPPTLERTPEPAAAAKPEPSAQRSLSDF